MVENQTYAPFASLVGSFREIEGHPSVRLAYAQSEAMVRLLVEKNGESGIAHAVRLLRDGTPRAELAPALGLTEAGVLALLEALRGRHAE